MPEQFCAPTEPAAPDPQLLTRLAWECRWTDRVRSKSLAEQALALATAQPEGEALAKASALRTLAWQAKWRGDFETTAANCLQAKQGLDRQLGRHVLVDVYSLLGVVHYSVGRRDFAGRMVQRGFDLLANTTPPEARVDLLVTHSTILRYRGRTDESRHALHTALDHAVGSERARVQHNLARSLNHDNSHGDAAEYAEDSLALARQYRSRVLLPYALEVLATAYIELGRVGDALPLLDEALTIAQDDGDRRAECQLLNQSGIAHLRRGSKDDALALLTQGHALARSMEYPLWMKSFSQSLAQLYEARGDFQSAAEAYKEVVRLQNATRD